MRHQLFSELRTIYETTAKNPHTFRVTIKTKDMVDEDLLRKAVSKTTVRYPYFCVRFAIEGDKFYFYDNPEPMPVIHSDEPVMLGSEEANHHLCAISWWKNKIHLDVYHALTDGGGIYNFIKTLLYYYCSALYDMDFSTEGIRLAGEKVDEAEWMDPGFPPIEEGDDVFLTKKRESPGFQVKDGGIAHLTDDCIVYNIRIPENEFMRFNLSNDGSPGTIVSLFLSRAIESLHPDKKDPVVIAMCVNQRKALHAPLAHQSLVGDVRLVYSDKLKDLPFSEQATCYRGMVALQSDTDMVRHEVKEYQDLMNRLAKIPSRIERHKLCLDLMNEHTSWFTATVSYVGKADMGEAEQFVQEFHVMPSTALPSSATPLTLELSAFNGSFYVNFMQYFKEDDYLKAFIRQLRENNIDYDVLYQERCKYPGMIDLFSIIM